MDPNLDTSRDEEYGWKEILAEAFTSFFLSAPSSAKEMARRIAVTIALVMLSGGVYLVVREPGVITRVAGKPVEQQSLTERMRHVRAPVEQSLEDWFYENRPRGLMLVAWDDRTTLRGIWVKPEAVLHDRIGIKQIAAEIRSWAGPFVFGECVRSDYPSIPGASIAACPIFNDHDVWGYIAVVYHPNEVSHEKARESLSNLAHDLISKLY